MEYPKEARNTVNRKGKMRGKYDLETVHSIIQQARVVHVSFTPFPDDPFPVILPMIGIMGECVPNGLLSVTYLSTGSYARPSAGLDEPQECYLHGYVSSRIMNVTKQTVADGKLGLPVCVAASRVDGLVLALSPNAHSYNYRSAVLFGYATPVTDVGEKLWAMEQITNKVVPNRWENTRVPPNAAEMSSTQILKVTVENASAKVRDGPPGDELVDLKDDEVRGRVWAGYVPMVEQLLDPVASSYNRVGEVPAHVKEYIEVANQEELDYANKLVGVVKNATE
jgi:nitroimidazol reductase NimA-like FMN-containing flavoprotein (pyridoxamine 5'-phosphate oxidase superfamily)